MTKKDKPTSAELEILDVLWQKGNATVRDVHDEINARRPTVYTTVLKLMQIMLEKGLVRRDSQGKSTRCSSAWPRVSTCSTVTRSRC